MAESIPQLAWMARPDGHIYWYNRRWYEYTGTTPEQMEGWGWQEVHDPEVLPARAGAVEGVDRQRRAVRHGVPAAGGRRPVPPVPHEGRPGAGRGRGGRPLVRHQHRHRRPPGRSRRSCGRPRRRPRRPTGRRPSSSPSSPRAAHAAEPDPAGRHVDAGAARRARGDPPDAGDDPPERQPPGPAHRRPAGRDADRPGQDAAALGGRRLPPARSTRPSQICRSEVFGQADCAWRWTWPPAIATSTPTRRGSSRSSGT